MVDDKKQPGSQEDDALFEEHELDLNTPDDLEAIEDVTFPEQMEDDAAPIDTDDEAALFEEFTTLDEPIEEAGGLFSDTEMPADDLLAALEPPTEQPTSESIEDPFADFAKFMEEMAAAQNQGQSNQHPMEDAFSIKDLGYNEDNTATELLEEGNQPLFGDVEESDAFDDINADFPEQGSGANLGDANLFDYNESDMAAAEAVTASAGGSGSAASGSSSAGPGGFDPKNMLQNPRVKRAFIFIIMIVILYSIMRIWLGGDSEVDTDMIAPATPPAIPEITDEAIIEESIETVETPAPVYTEDDAIPPLPLDEPEEVAVTVTAVQPTPSTGLPSPQSAMRVDLPTQPQEMPAQLNEKLSELEASIMAIDDRIAGLSQAAGSTSQPQELSLESMMRGATPQTQQMLNDALQKIQDIDKKMTDLQQLQLQVQLLGKELSALKKDVVQQSAIVASSQAEINQTLSAAYHELTTPKIVVQAAIPGRAWLRSETGELLTVIPGDEVPGYGRVVSIDPTAGTVVMSSRVVLREY